MPRNSEDRIQRYKRKIKNLQDRKRKRRRVILSSDESDNSDSTNQDGKIEHLVIETDFEQAPIIEPDPDVDINNENDCPASAVRDTCPRAPPTSPPPPAAPAPGSAADLGLDPALLAALGATASDTPDFGPSIHDTLSDLWLPLLRKGLSIETKNGLLKEYLIPSNCKLLRAPALNAEISAAVTEAVRGRDKKYAGVQQQLGQGIAAVNRAMDVLLKSESKAEALKYLSDGCRILTDVHFILSKDRMRLITPSLERSVSLITQDSERDDTLFGSTLPDKIKQSQAVARQGLQIRKNVGPPKPSSCSSTSSRPPLQGNWSCPPRYSANRGGRGGNRRMNPPARRRPFFNSAAPLRQSTAPIRPHAPARQQ